MVEVPGAGPGPTRGRRMDQLHPGDTAPELRLTDQDGRTVDLADSDQRTVVYFYPKAFTPGCTTEACDFRDSLDALAAAGVRVLGVSADDVETLRSFHDELHLGYPLLSDPDSQTARRWGAWGEKTVEGKAMVGPLRSTVVVAADGTVESAEYNVQADGHVARLRESLGL